MVTAGSRTFLNSPLFCLIVARTPMRRTDGDRRCTRSRGSASRAPMVATAWDADLTAHRCPGNMNALELAKVLLDHGANPNARIQLQERAFNRDGAARTPPLITLGRHYLTYSGATPFYLAARNGDATYMRLLVERGADPKLPNVLGVTPLMVADALLNLRVSLSVRALMSAHAEDDRADSRKESRSTKCLIRSIADRRSAADSGSSYSKIVVTKYPRRPWISFNDRNKGSRLLFDSIMMTSNG